MVSARQNGEEEARVTLIKEIERERLRSSGAACCIEGQKSEGASGLGHANGHSA